MHLGVAQLVARYLGVVEAASSSLVTQTRKREMVNLPFFFILQGFSALFSADFLFYKTPQKRGKIGEKTPWYIIWYIGSKSAFHRRVEVRCQIL